MLRSQPSNGLRLGIAALLEIRAHFSHNVPPITSDRLQAAFKVVAGLNQRQTATFLGIKPSRLEWAGKGGIIKRDKEGFYPCETVKAQWFGLRARLTRQGKKAQPI